MTGEEKKMLVGEPYLAAAPELIAKRARARELTRRYNATGPDERDERQRLLVELFSAVGDDVEIELGPWVLGWVRVDVPLQVLSILGLGFLLFLAGLEIDVHQLHGRLLGLVGAGFALSFAIGLAVSGAGGGGAGAGAALVAIILTATSLGVVIPVLKDAGQVQGGFGRRGLGTALTALHVHDALARGCRTASLQSTEMAERVDAAVGFRDLGRILEYVAARNGPFSPGSRSRSRR